MILTEMENLMAHMFSIVAVKLIISIADKPTAVTTLPCCNLA